MIYCLEAGEPGKVVSFSSSPKAQAQGEPIIVQSLWSPLAWESEAGWCKSWSESEGWRPKSTDVRGQEKMNILAQQREWIHRSSHRVFCQALNRLDDTHPPKRKGDLLYSVSWFRCSPPPESPSQMHPETMFRQWSGASLCPIELTHN